MLAGMGRGPIETHSPSSQQSLMHLWGAISEMRATMSACKALEEQSMMRWRFGSLGSLGRGLIARANEMQGKS